MLTDVMDFDPKITSDGHGWHCNFHLGCGHDTILEDATNEKSCVQALRCLIRTADTKIHDLEDELAILQCQLTWSKADKQSDPYEICCAAFKEKIDSLTKSMKNLSNKRISNEDEVETTLKIRRPAESIHDIISTLTKHNISALEERVDDLSNEMKSPINLGSVDIATNLRQTETSSDLSAESKELITNFERQCKPAKTISEESCSDISRCAIKDSFEARDLGKTDVKVTGKVEIDAFECTPEGINGFTTCLQEHNTIVNSKPSTAWHEETEKCTTGSKNSGNGSSPLPAKTEMVVKVEVDNNDISSTHFTADCVMQDQTSKVPIEGHQEVKESHSPSANSVEITYGRNRKTTGLRAILKPQGQKVQKMTFNGAKQANPRMLKPQGTIRKNKSVSITQSDEVNFFEKDDLDNHDPDSKSPYQMVVCLESPRFGKEKTSSTDYGPSNPRNVESKSSKEKTSPTHYSPANPHKVESKSTVLDTVATKESPPYDLETLRMKLSQEPDFLHKMKIPELKLILKFHKVTGLSKLKKDKMIEELTNRLKL